MATGLQCATPCVTGRRGIVWVTVVWATMASWVGLELDNGFTVNVREWLDDCNVYISR